MSKQHLTQLALESLEDVFPRYSKDKHLKLEQYGKTQIIVRSNSRVALGDVVSDVVSEKMYEWYDMHILARKGRLNRDGWVFPAEDYRLLVEFLQLAIEDEHDVEEDRLVALMVQSGGRRQQQAPPKAATNAADYRKVVSERDAAIKQRDQLQKKLDALQIKFDALKRESKDEKKNKSGKTGPSSSKKAKKETKSTISGKKKKK